MVQPLCTVVVLSPPHSCCSVVWYKPESMVWETLALNTPVMTPAGLEPATFYSQTYRSRGLSYLAIWLKAANTEQCILGIHALCAGGWVLDPMAIFIWLIKLFWSSCCTHCYRKQISGIPGYCRSTFSRLVMRFPQVSVDPDVFITSK